MINYLYIVVKMSNLKQTFDVNLGEKKSLLHSFIRFKSHF